MEGSAPLYMSPAVSAGLMYGSGLKTPCKASEGATDPKMEVIMADHTFCRLMLRQVMPWVNRVTTPEVRKATWPWHFHRDHHEWHGPGGFYWHGSACCKYMARYEGWCAWLKQHHPDAYVAMEQEATEAADKLYREEVSKDG
jgi:hypothetical protein